MGNGYTEFDVRFERRPLDADGRPISVGDCIGYYVDVRRHVAPVVGIGDGCVFTAEGGAVARHPSREVAFIPAAEVFASRSVLEQLLEDAPGEGEASW